MIEITVNGRPFDPQTLEEEFVKAAAEQLRARLGSIRHPDTGEFPTIVISGHSLDELKVSVEGSPELLALVSERLAEEQDHGGDMTIPTPSKPKAFLSYAYEDFEIAEEIANRLMAQGIDTWWSGWSIAAGDSLRQKIDDGLADCTHFLVLLTPASRLKPWVNQEMDAGLVRKLEGQATFIALRRGLAPEDLPPLLRGMLSPAVDDLDRDIPQLVSDIYSIAKKPKLGPPPEVVASTAERGSTGLSPAANAVARLFVEESRTAKKMDPGMQLGKVAQRTQLSEEDVVDALAELRGFVTLHRRDFVYAEDELFARYDGYWMPWKPEADALRIAIDLQNGDGQTTEPAQIAKDYEWEPRRLNPAMAYLVNRRLVRFIKAMNAGPWLVVLLQRTDETRRFVKGRA